MKNPNSKIRALHFLQNDRWCHDAPARTYAGERCYYNNPKAYKLSARGAIANAHEDLGDIRDAECELRKILGLELTRSDTLRLWERAPERTYAEVIEAFTKLAELGY